VCGDKTGPQNPPRPRGWPHAPCDYHSATPRYGALLGLGGRCTRKDARGRGSSNTGRASSTGALGVMQGLFPLRSRLFLRPVPARSYAVRCSGEPLQDITPRLVIPLNTTGKPEARKAPKWLMGLWSREAKRRVVLIYYPPGVLQLRGRCSFVLLPGSRLCLACLYRHFSDTF
jgi:hypothetical protein